MSRLPLHPFYKFQIQAGSVDDFAGGRHIENMERFLHATATVLNEIPKCGDHILHVLLPKSPDH